jgi:polyferredoxin
MAKLSKDYARDNHPVQRRWNFYHVGRPMIDTTLTIIFAAAAVVWLLVFGRLFCGKVCPAGFLQDLIYKIPFPLKIKTFKADKYLRLFKFAFIAFQVVLLFGDLSELIKEAQQGTTTVSTVAMPIAALVFLFIFIMVFLQRPFCKYFCPVGAISALGNKISLYKYRIKQERCPECGLCSKVCPMNIEPYKNANTLECIRCGRCIKSCPKNAIGAGFGKSQ